MRSNTTNNGNAINEVERAARCIASVCDGARMDDAQGFNKPDACIMHSILSKKYLTPRQTYAMYRILLKYRDQLKGFGIDYDFITVPKEVTFDTIKMTFGKYNGMTIKDVYKNDRSYVKWLARESYNKIIKDAANAIIKTRTT
ncbi:hypothetical protein KAU11_07915 [Candidatus Babeliales bacterium]|nr:hypothetical protein [Candidatus Babeliales bacterium]